MADAFNARFVDLVRNYTVTSGTGNFVLGAAVTGYRSLDSAVQPGESFYYSAIGIDRPDEFEVGRGTFQTDGTVSRDAIGGSLTDFSDGTKTVALVAAGEWYEGMQQGVAAKVDSAASRDALAVLSNPSKPAILLERGREGLFVFDPSDLSAQVAADTAQGILIAPASDPTGASGAWKRRYARAIEARWFGAVGDGIADDSAAIQAAFRHFETEGPGVVRLGNGTFSVAGNLWVSAAGMTIDARGATVQSADPASAPMMLVVADRARILGGTWKVTSGVSSTRAFDIVGAGVEIEGATILKEPDTAGVQMFIRYTADGFQMRHCTTGGSNGIQCESSHCAFLFNTFQGRQAGGDDGLAFKAIQEGVDGIRIIGNRFERLSYFCSIGSQVGVKGADDPEHTKFVRGVQVIGNTGNACAGILYIKPGGLSGLDYRDGVVEDVTVSDNMLFDLDGVKFERGFCIAADRGAKVRNVKGGNNLIRARASGTESTGNKMGFDLSVPGYGAAPSLGNIDVEFTFEDPHEGAANGPETPGYPIQSFANVDLNGAAANDIRLRVDGNGCAESGILVRSGADDVVTIEKARIRNAATGGSPLNAAVRVQSRIRVAGNGNLSLSAANGNFVSFDGGDLVGCDGWTANFSGDGDVYIPADSAMTVTEGKPAIGSGTISYQASTAAAPETFSPATLPTTLEAGAWLRVTASGVADFCAAHLIRIS